MKVQFGILQSFLLMDEQLLSVILSEAKNPALKVRSEIFRLFLPQDDNKIAFRPAADTFHTYGLLRTW